MTYKRISVDEVRELLDSRPVTLVDTRDPAAYAAGHMDNAISLNNQNIGEFLQQADRAQPLVVVCYHGHSSQPAAQYLAGQGFEEVYSMDGGFEAWKQVYPITTD